MLCNWKLKLITLPFPIALETLIMPKPAAFSQILSLVLITALFQICIAKTYNVLDFGAKADGKTDSSSAFVEAWTTACNNSNEASTVLVPPGTFMVNTVSFNGSCKHQIQLQISGNLVAPDSYKSLNNHEAWIAFNFVSGLSVIGGAIDAKGSSYWSCKIDWWCWICIIGTRRR